MVGPMAGTSIGVNGSVCNQLKTGENSRPDSVERGYLVNKGRIYVNIYVRI